jgi:hypothetical protein
MQERQVSCLCRKPNPGFSVAVPTELSRLLLYNYSPSEKYLRAHHSLSRPPYGRGVWYGGFDSYRVFKIESSDFLKISLSEDSTPSRYFTYSMVSYCRSQWPRGQNTGIVDSNLTWGMDVCVRLFCVCALLCAGCGLATGRSPVQGVLPTVKRSRNWKSGQGPAKGCRAIDRWVLIRYCSRFHIPLIWTYF